MRNNHYYVIYQLTFSNGQYYIGKAKDFNRRIQQHRRAVFSGANLKETTVIANGGFTCRVLASAPQHLSDTEKQIWMDNMERIIIHREAKNAYDEVTGENSNYADYQPYKDTVNKRLVNTQLY